MLVFHLKYITSHHITSHQASAHPANPHPVYSSAILPSCRTEWIQNPWKQLVSRPLLCIPIPSSVYSLSHGDSPYLALPCWSCGPHSGCWVALFHPQKSHVGRLVRTLQDCFYLNATYCSAKHRSVTAFQPSNPSRTMWQSKGQGTRQCPNQS